LAALALTAPAVRAQQNLPTLPQPRLQSVFPPGAKVGSTVEVTFIGTDIDEPDALHFSHPGLKAEPVQPPAPPADPKKPPMPMPPATGKAAKVRVTKFTVAASRSTPRGTSAAP